MTDQLDVLNGSGHLSLRWDPDNESEVSEVRAEVKRLKAAGYSFFLTDRIPADEVSAGHGELLVQRVDDPTNLPTSTWPLCQWNCPDCVATHPCGNCPDCPPLANKPANSATKSGHPEDDPEPQVDHRKAEWKEWNRRQQIDVPVTRRTVAVAPFRGG